MPKKGRPRAVASRACGTKLFVDDLREVVKLSQVEGKTISDLIRELVHETLLHRRLQSLRRDQEEIALRPTDGQGGLAGTGLPATDFNEIKELIGKFIASPKPTNGSSQQIPPAIFTILIEVLGFAMTSEMKTHLLLQNFMLSRGLGEEAVKKLIAEHEEKSRQNTEKIVTGIRAAAGGKEALK